MKLKSHTLAIVSSACLLMLGACQGPQYITDDPTILLNYQKDPTLESLTDLSKSYLNSINQNRKQGKVQPGLYCDYAVTLYLLGKPDAAEGWFNKEVSTFPYTATYVKQLRESMDERLNGADPNRNRRYSVDDVSTMDEIAVLRPNDNRQASALPKESVQESERISRDAVKGLDKPLTKSEAKALKAQQRDNKRQDKAAQTEDFTAPGERAAEQQAKVKAQEEKQEAAAQKKAERTRQREAQKAAKAAAKESVDNATGDKGAEENVAAGQGPKGFLSQWAAKRKAKKVEKQVAKEAKSEAKTAAKKNEAKAKNEAKDAKGDKKHGKKAKDVETLTEQRYQEKDGKAAAKQERNAAKQESNAANESKPATTAPAENAKSTKSTRKKKDNKNRKDNFDARSFKESFSK